MKKKSVSFVTSDKVGEAKQPKKEKNYIKFDIKESNYACFIEQRGQRSKQISQPVNEGQQAKLDISQKISDPKSQAICELKIPRSRRERPITSRKSFFANKILLLDYSPMDAYDTLKNPQHSSEEQADADIAHSCMRVLSDDPTGESCLRAITEETEPSINSNRTNFAAQGSNSRSATALMPIRLPIVPMQFVMRGYDYLQPMPVMQPMPPVRSRKTISFQQGQAYIIDLSKIESDGRTTIMVRNIPHKYNQEMLLELFERYKKKFDFFYLPIDYTNHCNVGYAFLNFIAAKFIPEFYNEFHLRTWAKFNSNKICNVCYARIQGTAQLENHFKHSNVLQQKEKKFRPLIGSKNLSQSINSLVQRQKQQQENQRESQR